MKQFFVLLLLLTFAVFSSDALAQKTKKTPKSATKNAPPAAVKPPVKEPEKTPEPVAAPLPAPDYEALAKKIVTQCANVKEGQAVYISGSPRDLKLLEDITANVGKVGAFPLLTITSDRLMRRMYDDVPAQYDDRVDEYAKHILKATDVMIGIEVQENDALFADIPASRIIARSKAGEELMDIAVNKNIIGVSLGNGLYPTAARAKRYGISLQQLSKIFWAGVNTDYDKLQATGAQLKEILASAQDIQITTPAGTDLKMSIYGKTAHVSDGVITEADISDGYASSNAYLPAGEVFIAPASGTAEGKIVAEKLFFRGKEIRQLSLDIKEGKVTSMTAAEGLEPLKTLYDAADEGKDEVSSIDLGINPDVTIPAGSSMIAWMPAGMVTVGLGENKWAGGDNGSSFALPLFLVNCTVKVDGKIVVENGKLKL